MDQGLKPNLYIVLARTAVPSGERGVPCKKSASISVGVFTHTYRFNQNREKMGEGRGRDSQIHGGRNGSGFCVVLAGSLQPPSQL